MKTNVNVTFDDFLTYFPEFGPELGTNIYEFESFLRRAQCYITTYNFGALTNCKRALAICLLVAHLMTIQKAIKNGDTSGLIQAGATIDKVSVSNVPPPTDENTYWFYLTPYGQQLLQLFEFNFASPGYIGGSFTRVL